MRNIGTNVKAMIESNHIRSVDLIEFYLDTPIFLTNNNFDLRVATATAGLQTFLGQGDFIRADYANETDELRVNAITIALSGVSPTWTNIVLNTNFLFKEVVVYKMFMNDAYQCIDSPVMLYKGVLTGGAANDSGDATTVTFQSSNQFFDFDRVNGRRTNSGSQALYFPQDTGFRFSSLNFKDVKWGKP